jgi:hypothetical protein
MKTLTTILAAVALITLPSANSQTPAQKPRNAVDVLKSIQAQNAKLLLRQAESLKKLEELEATTKIVKNLAARS